MSLLLLLAVGLALPGIASDASGEVLIRRGECGGPAVAYSSSAGEMSLVVWAEVDSNPIHSIRASRVTRDLQVLDRFGFLVYGGSAQEPCLYPDVAAGPGEWPWLVVWSRGLPPAAAVQGRLVVGPGQAGDPIDIAAASGLHCCPRAAASGSKYLVVWQDSVRRMIRGSRVSLDGTVLDPGGFDISPFEAPYLPTSPVVASDGQRFLVLWDKKTRNGSYAGVYGAFVEDDGSAGDPFTVSDELVQPRMPAIAFGQGKYLVAWRAYNPGSDLLFGIWVELYSSQGDTSARFPLYGHGWIQACPSACAGTTNYLVAWMSLLRDQQGDYYYATRARQASPGNAPYGVPRLVCDAPPSQYGQDVAFDGQNWLVVWRHGSLGVVDICCDTVSQWQGEFWSQSPLATAYNQSRNLALDPVTGWLHLVYESGDSIYYSYSDDSGEHWAPVECIAAEAAFPTVVCENQRVWVSYLRPVYHTIVCKTRLGAGGSTGAWDDYFVHPIDPQAEPGPPAMSREYVAPVDFDGIYAAYALDYGNSTTVEFRHVRHPGGVVGSYTLDGPSVLYSCGTPSVATTPGDFVHFAWWRHEADPTQRDHIVYRLRTPDGEWTEPTEVSNPALTPGCEPAFYPCVDAYGDRLTAVWGSQWQQQGEVWSRQKLVSESRFQEAPDNKSRTLAPSRYPQNSTSDVVAWQELVEPDNEDIWADFVGVPWPVKVQQDPFRSVYPDIFAVLPEPGTPDPIVINAVWTNATDISPDFFQVMFRRCETSADATSDYPYYDCRVGGAAQSQYCLARDGWAKWREFNVDYARERLRYRLPFLNPNCIYRLRAVLFHPARDTWTQTFSFEDRSGRSYSYRGAVPETVWLTIPPELYREDCAVTFDVIRQAGEFATVAELVLYQCYPFRRSSPGEDEAMSGFADATLPVRFCAVGPTPFRGRTRISYSVAHERDVNLGIYDVQGRRVRTLASGPHTPGEHAAAWDGTDNQGKRLPAGTYFCRLESSGIARSQRVIMLR